MSFSDIVKKEITAQPPRAGCDRRAMGAGIAFGAALANGNLTLRLPDQETAAAVSKLLRERFLDDAEININEKRRENGSVTLTFFSPSAALLITSDISREMRCGGCATAFLRGVFVAAGTVSNPRSASYHAEIILPDAARAGRVYAILTGVGSTPKIINRRNGTGLYFKSSVAIEELLVKLGANNAAFELMNCKIERTIRNDENRATNCVAKNISKTVSASRRQVEDIQKLSDCGILESLPFDLRLTAKLRLENPEASLSELAALHKPPISKSGLNHRLEKLSLLAEKH